MAKLFAALIFNALLFNRVNSTGEENRIENERTNNALIVIAKNDVIERIFNPVSDENTAIPFSSIQILEDEPSANQLGPDEQKIYLCSSTTGRFQPDWQRNGNLHACMYQMSFGQGDLHQCTDVHNWIVKGQNRGLKSCDADPSMLLGIYTIQLCIPIVETPEGDRCYRDGIENFIEVQNISTTGNQSQIPRFKIQYLELFQQCFNKDKVRLEWAMREVKPSSRRQRDLQSGTESGTSSNLNFSSSMDQFQHTLYSNGSQDETKPFMIKKKLIPSEENPFELWKTMTSDIHNFAPLWSKLNPLVDLIDKYFQTISDRTSRSIKVKTRLIYHQTDHSSRIKYADKVIEIPEVWSIQAYDEEEKSAITVVLHNTPEEQPPEPGKLCQEVTSCNFRKWAQIVPSLQDTVEDVAMEFAYCCKTTKFQMLDDAIIVNVIDVDSYINSSNND